MTNPTPIELANLIISLVSTPLWIIVLIHALTSGLPFNSVVRFRLGVLLIVVLVVNFAVGAVGRVIPISPETLLLFGLVSRTLLLLIAIAAVGDIIDYRREKKRQNGDNRAR